MSSLQAFAVVSAACGSVMLMNLLSKVLDPFVALVAATKPSASITSWSLLRAGKASALAACTTLGAATIVGGRAALLGGSMGALAGMLVSVLVGALAGRLFVGIRRLDHGHQNGLVHRVSVAARWPRSRPPRPPSQGSRRCSAFGGHLRLALMHRVRSPLLPLRVVAGLIGVPVVVGVHGALLSRGWDATSAVLLPAYLTAALNLADADVSPVANLGARATVALHSPYGWRRLTMASAAAALVPILCPIIPPLVALAVVSHRVVPVLMVVGGLVAATGLLTFGSARILDATEETPAALDLIADMVPLTAARTLNLAVAQVALGAVVWVTPI